MKNSIQIHVSSIITGLVAGSLAVAVLWVWIAHDPTRDFALQVPGKDGAERIRESVSEVINIGELSEQFDVAVPEYEGTWSQFRGADKSNIKKAGLKLADSWPEGGPPVKWMRSLGEGHAAAAIHKGRVYLLDYDETLKADMLRCLSLATGDEIWRCGYRVKIKRNHGISRTVPAVTDDYVVTIGPRCHVMCVRADTGEFLWGIDLEDQFGTRTPFWYTGQCPLIHDGELILAPGGSTLLMGVALATGDVLWESENKNLSDWKMSHASVVPMEFYGKKMYVYTAIGGVAGISGESGEKGRLLWSSDDWKHAVVAPSALQVSEDKIFLTAGYGAGSMVLQVNYSPQGNSFSTSVIQQYEPDQGLASEQQTPILYEGHLFGIQPKDGGGNRNRLVCVNPRDLTAILWSSGSQRRFGLGPYLIADEKIYILDDHGGLTMIRATAEGYDELGHYPVIPDGHDAWGPLALADGLMILRDNKRMVCVDLTGSRKP